MKGTLYNNYVKRVLDLMISVIFNIVLLPLFVIIAILIRFDSKGPVFFKQERIGESENKFWIYKFRTMYIDAPKDMPTHLLDNPEKMITPIGKILRKTSLDELPQLVNVLKGEMSIVGPRPALWNQYDLIEGRRNYSANGCNVNDLRPGITGWAQINGRDELPIDVKVAYDGEYLENISFLFDCKCIIKTVKAVICHDGYVEGSDKQ